ncbi:Bcr/CflA family drug resistance efflux transporter [Tersicoccus solisilvae]|uniref:Bcr/CflA family drug resistance efflux transporter n=1 Tax=Tersicoccus solisilvae TaxID=1882339 RepID=A0ABQ1NU26_9MICC|nr:multidrug effflux MFS transporter [Tersicoccus solisilvae]GGC84712.1 Bcr/CflA family drug resistance efflux transporter [Tersicoccus solisilvae]
MHTRLTTRSLSGPARGLSPAPLLAVGTLAMLGPLSTDIFLPALPTIAEEFGTAADRTQFSLSAVTIGMAAGQLLSGPVSDAVGRRRPLLAGSAAMALFALACALSPGVWVLILACFLMGCGAATGATVGRAVISDLAAGRELTRGFTLLGTLMAVGPIAAPVAGVLLMLAWGWRGIFVGVAVAAALTFVGLLAAVPESLPVERRVRGGLRAVPGSIATAARSRTFWCGATTVWAAFAASFAYIAASSHVLQTGLGFTPGAYAITFAVNGMGLLLSGLLTARLSGHWSGHRILGVGLAVLTVGTVLVAAAALGRSRSVWLILLGFFCLATACGPYIGPALAVAVQQLRAVAGTALALVGAVRFVVAGIVAPLAVLGGGRSLAPLATVVVAGTAVAWGGWIVFRPTTSASTNSAPPTSASTTSIESPGS